VIDQQEIGEPRSRSIRSPDGSDDVQFPAKAGMRRLANIGLEVVVESISNWAPPVGVVLSTNHRSAGGDVVLGVVVADCAVPVRSFRHACGE